LEHKKKKELRQFSKAFKKETKPMILKKNARTTQHWFKPKNLGQILHYHKHKPF
jgi:hypothetical protein